MKFQGNPMEKSENHLEAPKLHLWRYLPILIMLGLAVHIILPQITTLEHSWAVIRGLTWWAVALSVVCQVLSYLGSGYLLHALMETNKQHISVGKGALITLGSYSVGLVAGGWVGGAAATSNWIHSETKDSSTAVLAGTLPSLLNDAILVFVAIVGVVYLLILHDLTTTQFIEFAVILIVLGLITTGIIVAVRFPEPAVHLAVSIARKWAVIRHKPYDPQNTISSVERSLHAWRSLERGKWVLPLVGAAANLGFDKLTIYFLFIAAGNPVSLGVLFAGYGLPIILGKLAFLFPGGVGVIETSMAALYTSLQVPNAICVVVILGYRLFSFWLPTILGFFAAAYLGGKYSRSKTR
jgi:uncharacterized protein (TIRG00374 family)